MHQSEVRKRTCKVRESDPIERGLSSSFVCLFGSLIALKYDQPTAVYYLLLYDIVISFTLLFIFSDFADEIYVTEETI